MKAIRSIPVLLLASAAIGLFQNCSGVGFSAAAVNSTEPLKITEAGPTPPPAPSATPALPPPAPAGPIMIKSIVFALDIHGGDATVTSTVDHDSKMTTKASGVQSGYLTSNSRISKIRFSSNTPLGGTVGYRITFEDPIPDVNFSIQIEVAGGFVDLPDIHLELSDGTIVEAPDCKAPFTSVYDASAVSDSPNGTPGPYSFQCDLGTEP